MDIVSHGLWGGAAFGRSNRRDFWLSFAFGIAPDLISFGVFMVMAVLGLVSGINLGVRPPVDSEIPSYVHTLYALTHSLVVFAVAYLAVYLVRRRHLYPMFAWLLHILVDIPTHATDFFPTPFLWPLTDSVKVDGIPWAHPIIFIPNVILLALTYFWFFYLKPRRQRAL